MPSPKGTRLRDAGRVSSDGFIQPQQGKIEHTFYFNTVACVRTKTEELLAKGQVHFPAAVIAHNETIGRRTGTKAVADAWWAGFGSVSTAFAFAPETKHTKAAWLERSAAAVIEAFAAFGPSMPLIFHSPSKLQIGEKVAGRLSYFRAPAAHIVVVHLNCTTDLAKAPASIAAKACNLVDYVNPAKLPGVGASVMAYSLIKQLMTTMPQQLQHRA